jgi:endonuclease/exonuclease/phosphatase family metal-dependent hydrolase
MGIAARRPLALSRLALPKRDARRAELDPREWPELSAPLELINLHIQAPHVFPPWRSLALRGEQIATLLPHFEATPEQARVVCGDLNATPLWPVYRALAARLPDLALEHAALRREPPRRTWGPWSGAPRLLRIDHVLGAGVLAANVQVAPVRGSDHSAVVVDLVSET